MITAIKESDYGDKKIAALKKRRIETCGGIFILLFLTLNACGPMAREMRNPPSRGPNYPSVAENPSAYTGANVVWGGTILETRAIPGGSELVIEQTPLKFEERPNPNVSRGMFLAKTKEKISPEEYGKGRLVSVAGVIVGEERRTFRAEEYVYPVVKVRDMYVWSEKVRAIPQRPYGWNWGGYGDFRGPLEQEWRPPDQTGGGWAMP